jgi:hypothetical protein
LNRQYGEQEVDYDIIELRYSTTDYCRIFYYSLWCI